MLTLRGDADKCAVLTGKTVAGERAGRPAQIARFIDLPLGESEAATQSHELTTFGETAYTLRNTGRRRTEPDQGLDTATPDHGQLAGHDRVAGPISP